MTKQVGSYLVLGLDNEKKKRSVHGFKTCIPSFSAGTRKVATLSMPSDDFHNLYSTACVLGHFASCSEHLQSDYYRESDTQTSPGGTCLLLLFFIICHGSVI